MKCWICGEDGNTGEHRLKASDLRDHFRPISQKDPIFLHLGEKKNIPIGSVKNDRLKSDALICANCNNKKTQPYDYAWESLSKHLRENWESLKKKKVINFLEIFPTRTKRSLVDFHLYFVKLFGCLIVEHDVPIDTKSFSNSLINRRPHKNIHIAFGPLSSPIEKNIAAITPITAMNYEEKSLFANFMYIFNDLAVNVIYTEVYPDDAVLKNTWHPTNKKIELKLKNFQT